MFLSVFFFALTKQQSLLGYFIQMNFDVCIRMLTVIGMNEKLRIMVSSFISLLKNRTIRRKTSTKQQKKNLLVKLNTHTMENEKFAFRLLAFLNFFNLFIISYNFILFLSSQTNKK